MIEKFPIDVEIYFEKEIDERLNVVRDIFRSVCSKYDIIFIDSTLTE